MPSRVGGLGKSGIDSVFGGKKEVVPAMTKGENSGELPVKDLIPNPFQPRKNFDPEKMQELVNSIKESGVIQPLIVRKAGNKYEIVAGERRWRAAQEAGLTTVPAVIRKYKDATMMEVALVENLQRSDLDPLEEALGIQAMMKGLNMTQAEVAKKLGMSRTAVTNSLRLLNLPDDVKEYVAKGLLTQGQVRPILALDTPKAMSKLAKKAVEGNWSTRILEKFIAAEKEGGTGKVVFRKVITLYQAPREKKAKQDTQASPQDIYIQEFQDKLVDYLGTRVKVVPNKDAATGGKIVMEYYNMEDLERLYDLLQKPNVATKLEEAKNKKFNI